MTNASTTSPVSKRIGDSAATLDRLLVSKHVKDLRLIVEIAFLAVFLVLIVGVFVTIVNEIHNAAGEKTTGHALRHVASWAGTFFSFFGPVLVGFGAIVAWAYQTGSARLGVVDLFACEISTLCRVATVLDTVRRYVNNFQQGAPPTGPAAIAHQFTSQESYFPVFEGNTRDLQTLDADVVINITAFYTYMKAVRDQLRTLAAITPQPGDFESPPKPPAAGSWREGLRNVIYMLFLSLESARLAIADLVEFEPEFAERTVVILISELEAFRFLCAQYPDKEEMHHQRIALRGPDYRRLEPDLRRYVQHSRESEKHAGLAPRWEPAWRLLPELLRRYKAAMEVWEAGERDGAARGVGGGPRGGADGKDAPADAAVPS